MLQLPPSNKQRNQLHWDSIFQRFSIPTTLMTSVLLLLFTACTPQASSTPKIALLAPFEGRYREIGYEALYAAQLAIGDNGESHIDLVPIDEGETLELTVLRAQALTQNPDIAAVILVGTQSTVPEVQEVLNSILHIVAGYWDTAPNQETAYMLASPEIDVRAQSRNAESEVATVIEQSDSSLSEITILTSGNLPDENFTERYLNSAEFAPQPGIVATLAYDATAIAIQSIQQNVSLDEIEYDGINGVIQFENGYWLNAPINTFSYSEDGELIQINE